MKRDTYCVIPSTGILRWACVGDGFNLLWWFDNTGAEDVAIEIDFGLGELTFVLILSLFVLIGCCPGVSVKHHEGSCHAHPFLFQIL